MDEIYVNILMVVVGAISGGIVSYFVTMKINKKTQDQEGKENIDTILSSIDQEISNNLKNAIDNKKNATQGQSTAQRTRFTTFSFTAYNHFTTSINTKLKDQLGENAINLITEGYNQCRKFNSDFSLYKDGKRPTSRLNAHYFDKIITNFEEYQKLRKNNSGPIL